MECVWVLAVPVWVLRDQNGGSNSSAETLILSSVQISSRLVIGHMFHLLGLPSKVEHREGWVEECFAAIW